MRTLHLACMRHASEATVQGLIEAYPDAFGEACGHFIGVFGVS